MTRGQPSEAEPHHRQWLHAMEAETTVPSDAMQIGRVYADHAARNGGLWAHVGYPALRRQTHQSYGTISGSITWLIDHGWLRLRPGRDGEPWRTGQRADYDLTIGRPGKARRRPGKSAGQADPDPNRYATRSGSDDGNRYAPRSGSAEPDRYASRSATATRGVAEPLRATYRERPTSDDVSLPRRGNLHAALAAVVPDVTERETELIREMIASRPGVRSPTAVLRAEIRDGNGPGLVATVRPRAAGTAPPDDPRPAAIAFRDLCPRCSRPGHGADDCPDREPPPSPAGPDLLPATAEPCAAGERCLLGEPAPIDEVTGYHVRCGRAATLARELATRAPAPAPSGVNLAAEQLAESRAAREAAEQTQPEAVAS